VRFPSSSSTRASLRRRTRSGRRGGVPAHGSGGHAADASWPEETGLSLLRNRSGPAALAAPMGEGPFEVVVGATQSTRPWTSGWSSPCSAWSATRCALLSLRRTQSDQYGPSARGIVCVPLRTAPRPTSSWLASRPATACRPPGVAVARYTSKAPTGSRFRASSVPAADSPTCSSAGRAPRLRPGARQVRALGSSAARHGRHDG
jgi:hypothetical protein